MISVENFSRYGFAAIVIVGLSQGYATAADSQKHADSDKQVVHVDRNIVSKHRAAIELLKQREGLLVEAITAHEEMLKAITSLQNMDKDAAHKSLIDAAKNLDMVSSRDPNLKLALINVHSYTKDPEITSAVVKDTVFRAYTQLTEGHIQQARTLLEPLVSEIRVSTDSLPIEIYLHAIKLASKYINDGKLKEAEHLLLDTMDTIVTREVIIPLPPVKAEMAVLEAERLIKIDASKNRTHAVDLLNHARQHLKVGKLLGYGDYKEINDEIVAAQSQINANTPDRNLFSRLKEFFQKIGKKM